MNVVNERYDALRLASLLPMPELDANKYSRGKVLLCAGSARYPGAACLAALAAQRMGAGYVEVLCAPSSVAVVQGFRSSLVVGSWKDVACRKPASSKESKPLACVVGCGFDASRAFCADVLRYALASEAPVLVDGGALALLASEEMRERVSQRADAGFSTVLTPHFGEAGKLLGCKVAFDAQVDCAAALARAYRAVAVLKGPDTFVCDGMRAAAVDVGTPALAKAGTGDVLAGMIGALLAQKTDAFDAAVLGVTLHGRAGRCAADTLTDICTTPEDVIECIPAAIRYVVQQVC